MITRAIDWEQRISARGYRLYYKQYRSPKDYKCVTLWGARNNGMLLKDLPLKKGVTYKFKVVAFAKEWELDVLNEELIQYQGGINENNRN
jgi:hypothetical protein